MTDAEILTQLVDWTADKTALLVIEADQSGDRPALPYLMIRFTGSNDLHENPSDFEFSEDVASGRIMARPVVDVEWRYSLHAYGDSPSDIMRRVKVAYHLAQAQEPLFPGLVVHELSQIRYVPEQVGEVWEPRAQMDLFLRGLTKDGHLIDTIEEYSFEFTRTDHP